MRLKLGDWVVPKGYPFPSPHMKIEIIEIRKPIDYHILGEQVRVRYYEKCMPNGKDMSSWERVEEYEIDLPRMRDEKLKEIGI
jgi:hypothetical protein